MKNLHLIQTAVEANVPVLVSGMPGVGKTALMQALARHRDSHLVTLVLSYRDPTDIGGWPTKPEKPGAGVSLEPPAWAVEAKEIAESGQEVILFFDEFTTIPPAVQAPALRVVHERVVGELELPFDKVKVVAAANPPDIAAAGWSLEAPMANRFAHVEWTADTDIWTSGMVAGFPDPVLPSIPGDWEEQLPLMRSQVSAFIAKRPELLTQVPKEEEQQSGAWPSPRTWDMAARLMAAGAHFGDDDQLMLLASCVGTGPASEFATWMNEMDLPNPAELLSNPDKFEVDEGRTDRMHAMLSGVVATTIQDLDKYWVPCWKILSITANNGMPDVSASFLPNLREAAERSAKVLPDIREHTDAFVHMLEKAGEL